MCPIAMSKSVSVLICFFVATYAAGPGPDVIATKGAVWPKPQDQQTYQNYWIIDPDNFSFETPESIGCPDFIRDAFARYWTIITSKNLTKSTTATLDDDHLLGNLVVVYIDLTECPNEDVLPALGDNEEYIININENGVIISAPTIWGVLRGLETFSQLVYVEQNSLVVNTATIYDFPRFSHRGLLLDTSRHFQPLSVILQMLDAMAYNKLNVFHWHLTDDHSFPYKSSTYPELSDQGAYDPVETVYQQSDIIAVIEYARLRGIRVIPEFDTPGHTRSWGVSHPELLTTCYTGDGPNGQLGPMDPAEDTTFDFITNLFTEVVGVFPDSYFHIGGDEVDFDCWRSNPKINVFMWLNDISSYEQLENYFIQKVVNLLDSLDSKYLVWQEVFDNGVELSNSTVVHVWKEEDGLATLRDVVQAGKYGLYSACWYLSGAYIGPDWDRFYTCEPLTLIEEKEQRQLVIGGEACMWGEYVNQYNLLSTVWPQASAVAERLWSAEEVTDIDDAQRRLEEHACRMNKRGIPAQPANGPGVCLRG